VAWPMASTGAVPSDDAPSKNSTVPEAVGLTVAVSVTFWWHTDGLGLDVSVVVDGARFTSCAIFADELAACVWSPVCVATNACPVKAGVATPFTTGALPTEPWTRAELSNARNGSSCAANQP